LRSTRGVVGALCAAVAVCATLAADAEGQVTIEDPQDFVWTYHPGNVTGNAEPYYSGTMEVGVTTLTIGGVEVTTRAYRQKDGAFSIPGPTLRMTPGNKYVLRFHNTLPYDAPVPDHNVYKDPNYANLHTHGLHISGESPGDDVTRSFAGGTGGDFVYDIPDDHMGGTFWYHAHNHGSTYLQVSGGMFGLIIIDDSNDGIPDEVAAMQERQVILGFLDTSAAGTGGDTLFQTDLPGRVDALPRARGRPHGHAAARRVRPERRGQAARAGRRLEDHRAEGPPHELHQHHRRLARGLRDPGDGQLDHLRRRQRGGDDRRHGR
jgi:FtsP/CotA-like multicopper oxidase with cupredoxin domain